MVKAIFFNLTTRVILDTPEVPETDIQVVNPENADEIRIPGTASVEDDYMGFGDVALPREAGTFSADKTDILNDDLDAVTIILPDPCFLSINGTVEAVTGGVYSFTTPNAGRYILALVGRYKADAVIITAHDLTALKTTVKKQIKKQYEAVLYGGFDVDFNGNTYSFQSDETSMNLISGTAAVAGRIGLPPEFVWKTSDNQFLPFSVTEMQALETAMFGHISVIFTIKEGKNAALAGLLDLDPVVNFDVMGGWS